MNAIDEQAQAERSRAEQQLAAKQTYDPNAPVPSPEQEEMAKKEVMRMERLQAFGVNMARLRDSWVQARIAEGVDRRMREDRDQYDCIDAAVRSAMSMMETVAQGGPAKAPAGPMPTRSTIFVGLTRAKTNAAEAHLSDILLPVDDKNWGIAPTPNAQLAIEMKDDTPATHSDGSPVMGPALQENGQPQMDESGQPVAVPYKKSDIAQAIQKMAAEAAEGMQREIDDQLTECDYISEQRKMLHDAAVYGTGVMRGPVVTSRTRRAWVVVGKDSQGRDIHALKVVTVNRPASFRRDPRFVWTDPACGDDPQNGRGVIEMEEMTPRRVRDLAKQPGYLLPQLAAVLREGPKSNAYISESQTQNNSMEADQKFFVWTYTGELDIEDLIAAGVEGLPADMTDDERTLLSVSGEVTLINSTVVRAVLNPLESGELPYDFYQWEVVTDSVWGYGVPYLLRAIQKILNSAWRQCLDNSAVTVMPQIVMTKGAVTPADGTMTLYGGKVWYANADIADVQKAFFTFDIPNHQDKLESIIRMAEDMADKDSGTPMLAQGERGSAPDTVGGMQLLMNSTNVVRRRQVKYYDDRVTKRHIRRYYDWNMAYSPKDDIKGDFEVDARGSSALLVRDIQNQAMLSLAQTAQNPLFAKYTDFRKLYGKMLQAQHIKAEDVLKPDDQVKREEDAAAKNPPPEDIAVQVARINAESRQAMAKQAEDFKAQMTQMTQSFQERMAAQEMNLLMLRMAHEKGQSLDQIKADLAKTGMTLRSQERRLDEEAQLRRDTGAGV